jgi:GLPGLI family protein
MKYSIVLALLFALSAAHAQQTTGTITYTATKDLDALGIDDPAILAMLKDKLGAESFQLLFNEQGTFYTPSASDEKASAGGVMMEKSQSTIHQNLTTKAYTKQTNFLSKDFLIEDRLPAMKWQLGNDQKEILGYTCTKATTTWDDQQVTAWFTPQLPVSVGPELFNGLPGVILALDINDGAKTIEAVDIDTTSPIEFEVPTKGKKVDQATYDEIVKEKTEALQKAYGGGGNVRVIKSNGNG